MTLQGRGLAAVWKRLSLEGNDPAYQQIVRQIKTWIEKGDLPLGTTLPSERKLAEFLGISRITVQHSYNLLREQQLIRSQGRLGSVVAGKLQPPMNRLRGFTDEMRELGREPSAVIKSHEVVRDAQVAASMQIAAEAPLLRLNRHRFADGVPMSNELAWYNLQAAPFLAESDLSGSVYHRLETEGLRLAHCEQSVEAVLPKEDEVALFGFDPITPCMLIKRITFDTEGRILEYVEGLFRGDMYRYRLQLDT